MDQVCIARRVLARYLWARSLGVGRSVYRGTLLFQRYKNQLIIKDLSNAGRPGKKVQVIELLPPYAEDAAGYDAWFDQHLEELTRNDKLDKLLADLLDLEKQGARVYRRELPGEKVAPHGDRVLLKTNGGLIIDANPLSAAIKPNPARPQPFKGVQVSEDGGAPVFYAWLRDNLSKVNLMPAEVILKALDHLGVGYG
jgi:hypothetical protein